MVEEVDASSTGNEPVCHWCGKQLSPHEHVRGKRVCEQCVRKLRESGLSDKEIFIEGPPQKDKD
jgi:predicted amidophosphoribosyltransferase